MYSSVNVLEFEAVIEFYTYFKYIIMLLTRILPFNIR